MKKTAAFTAIALLIISCNLIFNKNLRQNYSDINKLMHQDSTGTGFLKAHTANGDVYLFKNKWRISQDKKTLSGDEAEKYNARRSLVESGRIDLAVSEIVLLETNLPAGNIDAAYFIDLGIITVFDAVITAFCISNPKACFGSCPTFYYNDDQHLFSSHAEGFSSSIAPSMEKGDIDALNNPTLNSHDFSLIMKNEAMETHAVNQVALIAVPREPGTRIFYDADGIFYQCAEAVAPVSACGPEGEILPALSVAEGEERFSLTDADDLKTKEIIDLTFNNNADKKTKGLVLNFRQTLLPTFLFYSALSFMGDEMSDVFAGVETFPLMRHELKASLEILGGIEVIAWNEEISEWQKISTQFEAGPIARNLQLVKLPAEISKQDFIKIRLRMSKGLWRIDYTGLANIHKVIEPVTLSAFAVDKNGKEEAELTDKIKYDDQQYLLSMPGDKFVMHYHLPGFSEDYELFVYSKGYYLEWTRKEWLPGKDLVKLRKMVLGDELTWRDLAREFKQQESSMEASFWNSRVNQ